MAFFSAEVAVRDAGNFKPRLAGHLGDTERGPGGRSVGEELAIILVHLGVLVAIFEIDERLDHVLHVEPGRLQGLLDLSQAVLDLLGKLGIRAIVSLARDVERLADLRPRRKQGRLAFGFRGFGLFLRLTDVADAPTPIAIMADPSKTTTVRDMASILISARARLPDGSTTTLSLTERARRCYRRQTEYRASIPKSLLAIDRPSGSGENVSSNNASALSGAARCLPLFLEWIRTLRAGIGFPASMRA